MLVTVAGVRRRIDRGGQMLGMILRVGMGVAVPVVVHVDVRRRGLGLYVSRGMGHAQRRRHGNAHEDSGQEEDPGQVGRPVEVAGHGI